MFGGQVHAFFRGLLFLSILATVAAVAETPTPPTTGDVVQLFSGMGNPLSNLTTTVTTGAFITPPPTVVAPGTEGPTTGATKGRDDFPVAGPEDRAAKAGLQAPPQSPEQNPQNPQNPLTPPNPENPFGQNPIVGRETPSGRQQGDSPASVSAAAPRDSFDSPVLREALERAEKKIAEAEKDGPAEHTPTGREKSVEGETTLEAIRANSAETPGARESRTVASAEAIENAIRSGTRGPALARLGQEFLTSLTPDEFEAFRPLIQKIETLSSSALPGQALAGSSSVEASSEAGRTSGDASLAVAGSTLIETRVEGKDKDPKVVVVVTERPGEAKKPNVRAKTSSLLESLFDALTGDADKKLAKKPKAEANVETASLLPPASHMLSALSRARVVTKEAAFAGMTDWKGTLAALIATFSTLFLFLVFRRRKKKTAVLILALLFSSKLAVAGGDAEGFGGGDGLNRRVLDAKAELTRSLTLLRFSDERKRACALVASLTPRQVEECDQILGILVDKALSSLLLNGQDLKIVATPLKLNDRPVQAMTRLGVPGPITLHGPSLERFTDTQIVALLAHELGHQIEHPQFRSAISDEQATLAFGTGRALLDSVGRAVALFAQGHASPPQRPPSLPLRVAKETCGAIDSLSSAFAAGVWFDTRRQIPSAEELKSLASDRPRVLAVREGLGDRSARETFLDAVFEKVLGRKPTVDERENFLDQLGRVPLAAVYAALVGNEEFSELRKIQSDGAWIDLTVPLLVGRAATVAERGELLERISSQSRPRAMMAFLKDNEAFLKLELQQWYSAYLNRNPSTNEVSSQIGRLKLDGNFDGVRGEILASDEYFALQGRRWAEVCLARR